MFINSSSSNVSVFPPQSPPSNIHLPSSIQCLFFKPSSSIFTTFSILTLLLLLPLCIYILYHGFQELWLKRSSSSVAAAAAHSDSFTYHVVAMDLCVIFGFVCACISIYSHQPKSLSVSSLLLSMGWQGETLLQTLTCGERYLAVIHPITYLSLKNTRGIRMRNISIGCVWLFSFAGVALAIISEMLFFIMEFLLSIGALLFASFCSFSILCALIRPHPGEQGGRERLDQSKLKALYIIGTILLVLVLRFSWALVHIALFMFPISHGCIIAVSGLLLYLPSSLILPLLFLHRAGKLLCCLIEKPSSEVKG